MRVSTSVGQDVAYALRQIRRAPGLAAVIVLTLGGAMAANTSLFSVFDELFLRPWPVEDPDGVVAVRPPVSLTEWRDWAERTTAFSGVVASGPSGRCAAKRRRLSYQLVSANYFQVLGVPLRSGRGFEARDDRPDGPGTAAIVSDRIWREELGADPAALGESIALDGLPFAIAGIAAPPFDGVRGRVDVWLPLAAWTRLTAASDGTQEPSVSVAGRLAPGTPAERAQAELATLSAGFRRERGLDPVSVTLRPTDRYAQFSFDQRALVVYVFLLAPTFLTLVACANVANLLTARGHARRGEIAVRLALGGSRFRLARQLVVEALILGILAGALGLAVASALPRYLPATVPQLAEVWTVSLTLHRPVFAWAFGVSVLAAIAFGVAPALQCTRISVSRALQDAHGLSAPALKSRLLGYQVTVSVAVLVLAGLLARSVQVVAGTGRGYSVEGLALAQLQFPLRYDEAKRRSAADRFFGELEATAGHDRVAVASAGPLAGTWVSEDPRHHFDLLQVSRHYFDLMRIPVVAGRAFEPADGPDGVVIVNEAAARLYWPDEYPIGQELGSGPWSFSQDGLTLNGREVVGVARDAQLTRLGPARPLLFVPTRPAPGHVFVVGGPLAGDVRAIAVVAERLDPAVYVDVLSGPEWVSRPTSLRRLLVKLLGGFAGLALGLSTVGLFSVAAYGVERRRREIGIRMALGARRGHVIRAVFSPAGRATSRGLVVGGTLAACTAFLIRHLFGLHGVSPLDPPTYAAATLVLVAVGALAVWLPARQALRMAPVSVLRHD